VPKKENKKKKKEMEYKKPLVPNRLIHPSRQKSVPSPFMHYIFFFFWEGQTRYV